MVALLGLLGRLGTAVRHLSRYECREAIAAVEALEPAQQLTAWAQCQLGKAHFQLTEHDKARSAFERARRLDPHRVEDMEVFSAVLWHLRCAS
jgi:anaphase-promoting complex subunit 3